MALAIETPTCFKCGKDLISKQKSIGINNCKLPTALTPTGNVKIDWVHNGECIGETEEYKSIKNIGTTTPIKR